MEEVKIIKEVIIKCENESKTRSLANQIHNQLIGNMDYVNSYIVLHFDGSTHEISLTFDSRCSSIPHILI